MTRRHALAIAAAVALIGALFAGTEWALRQRVWASNREAPALNTMLLYSGAISRQPNKTILFRLYGANGVKLLSADVRINNRGLISHNDYRLEREPGEFRILVLGGEQTASTVANQSWPDHLQDELNRRDSNARYRVFNLAWPDAGPMHYIDYWNKEGKEFGADLVIVNYVESDFYRGIMGGPPPTYRGHPIGYSKVEYRVGPVADDVARFQTTNIKDRPVTSLRDPSAVPSRPFGFFVSAGFANDDARIRLLQAAVVDDMIAGSLVPYGRLVWRLLTQSELGIDVATDRNFDSRPSLPIDRDAALRYGTEKFGWIARNIPNVVITHNFHHLELKTDWEMTEAMKKADRGIRVVDMRKRVPASTDEEELRSWYYRGIMDEKWSDKGHRVYGAMMAMLVLDHRSGKQTE